MMMPSLARLVLLCVAVVALAGVSALAAAGPRAVYVSSNSPNGNNVLVYAVNSNGTLSYVQSVSTGGKGTSGSGGDTLFSQDSVAVYQNFLFVVNAGSNSVSLFTINPNQPTSITLVNVASSNGDYPVSVAAWGTTACVLNGGPQNGIHCFTFSASAGLVALSGWDRSTGLNITSNPPQGPPNTVSDIIFSPDGLSLIVTIKQSPGGVLIYPINRQTMTLAATPTVITPNGLVLPFSVTPIVPNGLFVTDPGSTSVGIFAYDSVNGNSDAANKIPIPLDSTKLHAPCWSNYIPSTGHYIAVAGSGSFVEFNVDPVALSATIVQYVSVSSGTLDSTVVDVTGNCNDYIYAVSPAVGGIAAVQVVAAGNLQVKALTSFPAGTPVTAQGIASYPSTEPAIQPTASNMQPSGAAHTVAMHAAALASLWLPLALLMRWVH